MLFTASWWKDAVIRAARTALIFAIPFFPAAAQIGGTHWLPLVLSSGFGFITSLITSVAVLPQETTGVNVPKWKAIAYRMGRSFAQGLVTGIGTAVILTDVDWVVAIEVALTGAVGSLILGLLTALPETAQVITGDPVLPPLPPVEA